MIFKFISRPGVIALALSLAMPAWAELDAGGTSVDLGKMRGVESSVSLDAPNLVQFGDFESPEIKLTQYKVGNWLESFNVHSPIKAEQDLALELDECTSRKIVTLPEEPGNRVLKMQNDLSAQKYRSATGTPMMSGKVAQTIEFPEPLAEAVKYTVSFRGKGKQYEAPGLNAVRFFATCFAGEPWKSKELCEMVNLGVAVTPFWSNGSLSFIAPKGTKTMIISFALYGVGEFFLDDVAIRRAEVSTGPTVRVTPMSFLDNLYQMGEGKPGILVFAFRNESAGVPEQLKLEVTLPAGIEFVESPKIFPLLASQKAADGAIHLSFDMNALRGQIGKERYGIYRVLPIMVRSNEAASKKRFPVEYFVSGKDYQSPKEVIDLEIVPALADVKAPEIFKSGAMLMREADYEDAGADSFADFYIKNGFNSIHGSFPQTLSRKLKKGGIERYVQPYLLCNGYRLGGDPMPREVQYLKADKTHFLDPNQMLCPVAVYEQSDYYKNSVETMIETILNTDDSADQIMPNWEPYYVASKGCFCDRCLAEFVRETGGDAAEIGKVWNEDIINTPYGKQWIRFRSKQHGKLMVTLAESIRKIGKKAGKESFFIPELGWHGFLPKTNQDFQFFNPLDFMSQFDWLEPWGPYLFQPYDKAREYHPGLYLIGSTAAREMKDFVAANTKGGKTPKLIAFPHGLQCDTWVTTPEGIGFELLSYFFRRWDGAIVYYMSGGYDYRYWRAIAESNRIISDSEAIVLKGKDISKQAVFRADSPLPQTDFPDFWQEGGNFKQILPTLTQEPIVQSFAFEQDGKVIAAVGNFWEKGEVFGSLSIAGLDANKNYAVKRLADNSWYLGAGKNGVWSGKELAKGLLIHIGALRYEVLEITPATGNEVLKGVTQGEMAKQLKLALPGIEKQIEWEKAHLVKMRGK